MPALRRAHQTGRGRVAATVSYRSWLWSTVLPWCGGAPAKSRPRQSLKQAEMPSCKAPWLPGTVRTPSACRERKLRHFSPLGRVNFPPGKPAVSEAARRVGRPVQFHLDDQLAQQLPQQAEVFGLESVLQLPEHALGGRL